MLNGKMVEYIEILTVPALGHESGEWEEVSAVTCTEKGEETRTCKRCGEIEKRDVDAIGHTEEVLPAVAATCTQPGLTAGKKCSVCGEIITAQNTVAKANHQWSAWKTTKKATALAAGEQVRTCSICGAKKTQAVRKLAICHHPKYGDIFAYEVDGSVYFDVAAWVAAEPADIPPPDVPLNPEQEEMVF